MPNLRSIVDPRYFRGTIYRAANWEYVGDTRGFRRAREGYSAAAQAPKRVFFRPLIAHVQARFSQPVLDPAYYHGPAKRCWKVSFQTQHLSRFCFPDTHKLAIVYLPRTVYTT